MYHVRLEQFEGPLPLLLALIEKEKLDITRLSLAVVAEQYLSHIARKEHDSLPNLSQFLSIASRLMLLKSQALLPTLSLTDEEEESVEELERRLREYQRYREAALRLGNLFSLGRRSFRREPSFEMFEAIAPPTGLSAEILRDAFTRVLDGVPFSEAYDEETLPETVTIEERMAFLEDRLSRSADMLFSEVISVSKDRVEAIVSFLALLELIRRNSFFVEQGELFGEIRFRRSETLL
jgi:segregation and condensation protein A